MDIRMNISLCSVKMKVILGKNTKTVFDWI